MRHRRTVDALKTVIAQRVEAVGISDSPAENEGRAIEQPAGGTEIPTVVPFDPYESGETAEPRYVHARAVGRASRRGESIVASVTAGREPKRAVALVALQDLPEHRSGSVDSSVVSFNLALGIAVADKSARRVVFA